MEKVYLILNGVEVTSEAQLEVMMEELNLSDESRYSLRLIFSAAE